MVERLRVGRPLARRGPGHGFSLCGVGAARAVVVPRGRALREERAAGAEAAASRAARRGGVINYVFRYSYRKTYQTLHSYRLVRSLPRGEGCIIFFFFCG